ncbi:MAG TPA: pyrroline-5-carboxylate reductase [Pseudogracilibacillus sp.]|nr:pyrroline-5-carboxylate reductase [Pseudogracilibacillus sp.]
MKKIAFIGAGSMAEAVFAGLVNKKFVNPEQIYVSNKENEARLREIEETYGVIGTTDKQAVMKDADIVFLAMKPYDLESSLLELRDYVEDDQLFISVIAGKSTSFIQKVLEKDVAVIRSMPNTSATIGLSATAIAKGAFASEEDIALTEKIFSSIGTVSVVEEEQIHIVTGISGSGPAYVYYLVEAMQIAAEEEGLESETARQLISQTIIGAGKMLQERTESAATLRKNVTSPNGTTAAGIEKLQEHDVKQAVIDCVKSATRRSKELGQEQ